MLTIGLLGAAVLPRPVLADGAWLDNPGVVWNTGSMPIPKAPPIDPSVNPRCVEQIRPAESAAGRMVEASGWKIYTVDVENQGLRVVHGLAGWDGMCRPMVYQAFVFTGASEPSIPPGPRFIGTMSPVTMDSRTDGALNQVQVFDESHPDSRVVGRFARYTPQDPLCCPSGTSTVTYRIAPYRSDPVLSRVSTVTEPTGAPTSPPATPAPVTPAPVMPAPAQVPRT
jgi:hypothetical protein